MGKKNFNKNYISLGIVLTVSVCVCITFYELLKQWRVFLAFFAKLWSAMTPFTIGFVLAFLLSPIMGYIRRGIAYVISKNNSKYEYDDIYRKSKVPSLVLTMLLFFAIVTGFLWLVIPKIYISLKDLVNSTPQYLADAQAWIEKMFSTNEMLEGKLQNALSYIEDNVYSIFRDRIMPNLDTVALKVSSGVMVGIKAILNFFVGIIVTIYLLASKDVLKAQAKKLVYWIFSREKGNKILDGVAYANMVFGGFINGKIIDSIIIGILCFVFTSAVGMKYAVLMSVIVGVTNIIPFFGPFIGAVPGALLALMDDPIMLVVFVVWIIVLQQFDGNILGPLILGDSTGLSGIWVLLAILVAGDLFGVAGMILGVPVFACIYAFFAIQLRDGLRKKNLSSDTKDYIGLKGFDEKTGQPIYRDKREKRRKIKNRKSLSDRIKLSKKSRSFENFEADIAAKLDESGTGVYVTDEIPEEHDPDYEGPRSVADGDEKSEDMDRVEMDKEK